MPIPSHLDRTSLVNKRFIIWHKLKEHWKKWSSYLFVFEHWKGNHSDAKVMARTPISWLDKCRKYNHLIGYISNSNFKFKFSNSKQTFVFAVFVVKRIFKTQHFCFLCFHSRWRFFWFHKDREITKNLFTLAENNFGERKPSCTCLNFGEILLAGTKQAVPGGQYRSISPARVANQNTEFAAYCPSAELAI